ncbi:hypothetical protein BU17DRAFT_68557 [Hysterangium stoloniferum]|nr:hypothetical protein BU17DRAFT_68557 [Hysterangium stoloniferum]
MGAEDNELEAGQRDKKGDECDDESVATNDSDEFDFSAIRGSSTMEDALDAQKTARVFFELDQVTPKLGQLAEYLKHAHMTKLDLTCAAGSLGTLITELKRMMNDVEDDTSSIDPPKSESHPIPSAPLP